VAADECHRGRIGVPSKSISGKAETVSGTEAEATSGVRPRVGVSSCYVFKATSPSCGIGGIPRYAAGRRPADHRGRGVFAARVMARYPLQHAFSRVSRHLDPRRRADMAARIESYRRGTVPLSVPIAILAHYASDDELPWLAGQTWNRFRPRSACATTCRASAEREALFVARREGTGAFKGQVTARRQDEMPCRECCWSSQPHSLHVAVGLDPPSWRSIAR
jgi:Protein of unknown function (DUF1722)